MAKLIQVQDLSRGIRRGEYNFRRRNRYYFKISCRIFGRKTSPGRRLLPLFIWHANQCFYINANQSCGSAKARGKTVPKSRNDYQKQEISNYLYFGYKRNL